MAGFELIPGSGRGNYTGFMTRSIVFSASMIAFMTSELFSYPNPV